MSEAAQVVGFGRINQPEPHRLTRRRGGATRALDVSLPDAARLWGTTRAALHRIVLRKAKEASAPDGVFFDNHDCRKNEDGDWWIRILSPWVDRGTLRRFEASDDFARRNKIKPATLRRRFERHSALEDGVWVARCNGLVAFKFSGRWKVCLDEGAAARA